MDREKELQLIAQCLELAKSKAPFMPGEETLMPVSKYTDEERFEREQAALFRQLPNVIAHSSQIAKAGDFITRELSGIPVLLVRGSNGEATAFVNVCRHRGSTVELRESGSCKRFVCPYHAWTYNTDGTLAKVRHQEGFPTLDIANTSLVKLPTFEASGLIWVIANPAAKADFEGFLPESLLSEIAGLGCEDLEVFDSYSQVWKANWKLVMDGGLESYHFKIAHKDTIASMFLDNVSTFEMLGNHTRSVLPRTSLLELEDKPRSEWRLRECTNMLYSLLPNASLLVQVDHIVLILATPATIGETLIEMSTLAPKSRSRAAEDEKYWQANHDFTVKALKEDFSLGEHIQRGMSTGVNEHFRFARFEAALTRTHEILERLVT